MRRNVPKNGDWRNKQSFLWLPMRIYGEQRWLEFAEYRQFYSVTCGWCK